jgi:hypothetical protein
MPVGAKNQRTKSKNEHKSPYFPMIPIHFTTKKHDCQVFFEKKSRFIKYLIVCSQLWLIETIFYYGAGCAYAEANKRMFDALKNAFGTEKIEINSDLLAAARALCGHDEGIACILGTGSNSCLFDGVKIVDNTPSLGYILGDEGSGAALGKRLVSDCLKKQLSPALTKKFLEKYNLTTAEILEQVYHKPMPNRYLAQFAPFLAENRKEAEVQTLLKYCFTLFFQRNTMVYRRSWLPIHIVGGIGVTFANELKETAESLGLSIGNIVESPMNGLIEYHK